MAPEQPGARWRAYALIGLMLALLPATMVRAKDAEALAAPADATVPTASPTPAVSEGPMARTVKPERIGYAFSNPAMLLRQRLIGLAHGLRLLGRTCLLDPQFSLQAEQAYAAWFARQGKAIDAMSLDLERWYFGSAAPEPNPSARLREVIRLIGLRNDLRPMDEAEQAAACASYPQAIAGPRYDFVQLLADADRELAGKPEPDPASRDVTGALADPVTTPVTEPVADNNPPIEGPSND